jgi:hypothetical protein
MNINFSFDSSVSNAPSGFTNVFNQVASFFASTFQAPVTLNIDVGYGEIGGQPLASGAVGESSFSAGSYSYSQIKSALAADSKSSIDASAVASLPASNPTSGNYLVSSAEAKALGLSNNSGLDGSVGFAPGNYDFDNSNGVPPGQLDFFGAVAHEVSEIMGRFLLLGQNGYSPMDLFHFSAPNVRTFSAGGYFSADNGATNLGSFNAGSGDKGDWSSSVGPDSFLAVAQSGVLLPVSAKDIKVLDALGWDGTSANAPPPPPADTTPTLASSPSSPFAPFFPRGSSPYSPFTPSNPTSPSTPTTPASIPSSSFAPFFPRGFNPYSPFTGSSLTSHDEFVFNAAEAQNVTSDSYGGHKLIQLRQSMAHATQDAGTGSIAQGVFTATADGGLIGSADPTHGGMMHLMAFHFEAHGS